MRSVLVLVVVVGVAIPVSTSIASIATKRPAQREPFCEIVEHGLYTPDEPHTRHADPGSVTGERFEIDAITFVEQTTTIARVLGTGFGIRYRLRNLPRNKPVDVSWRVAYPKPIRGSTGWQHGLRQTTPDGVIVQHLLYDFVHDWEMVAGRWRFQIFVDGQPACSFAFVVK